MRKGKEASYPGRILYSRLMKSTLYLVMIAAIGMAVFCVLSSICCSRLDDYKGTESNQERYLEYNAWKQAREIMRIYLTQDMEQVELYVEQENISYAIHMVTGRRVGGNYKEYDEVLYLGTKELEYEYQFTDGILEGQVNNKWDAQQYRIKIAYLELDQVWAVCPYLEGIPDALMQWREDFLNTFWIAMGIAIVSLLYLLWVSGYQPGSREIHPGRWTDFPIELAQLWWVGAVIVWLWERGRMRIKEIPISWSEGSGTVLEAMKQCVWEKTIVGMLIGILLTGFLLHMSLYVKAGKRWENSLVWKIVQAPKKVLSQLSLVKKTLILVILVCCLEAAGIGLIQYRLQGVNSTADHPLGISGYDWWMIWGIWALEKGLLTALALRLTSHVMRLRISAGQLAEGNLGYQMSLKGMKGKMREFGQDMNAISQVVADAVEDRMKSEHLKTELITNVSHDIKTPLTSIINYADLIGREQTENEKITEYAQVLHRQSTRLKKLIEDLMEVSKISTGNMEAHLERCQAGVLLNQAMGEFEQRLQEKEIELIVKQGETPVWIMADPRLLWRILDNLMSNICKYAQNQTRVYLSMEIRENQAVLIFKNISKYALDVEASELLERFVRGDRSRHTEGSGLGLSIAKSLTQLQGGHMELAVDGDLFKVTLTFPIVIGEEMDDS